MERRPAPRARHGIRGVYLHEDDQEWLTFERVHRACYEIRKGSPSRAGSKVLVSAVADLLQVAPNSLIPLLVSWASAGRIALAQVKSTSRIEAGDLRLQRFSFAGRGLPGGWANAIDLSKGQFASPPADHEGHDVTRETDDDPLDELRDQLWDARDAASAASKLYGWNHPKTLAAVARQQALSREFTDAANREHDRHR